MPLPHLGEKSQGVGFNQQVPGPALVAHEGDLIRVHVTNNLKESSSVHWHGILLPQEQDGVPFLTTPPIMPGETLTYEFPVIQTGTYWYHSHSGLQEQRGLYGPICFYPKEEKSGEKDEFVVLSDWTNEHPKEVLRHLKIEHDYYALKKDAVVSWLGALREGRQAIRERIKNAWERMGPMDLSDVGYDAFLVNGREGEKLPELNGEKLRLRLINAASSSYFFVSYAGGSMTVVGSDGLAVEPVQVEELRIAVAETYDLLVDIPADGSFEVRFQAEDGTGGASLWLGEGAKHSAARRPRPNLYLAHGGHGGHAMQGDTMHHHQEASHGRHHGHRISEVALLEEYSPLRVRGNSMLPSDAPLQEVHLDLTGQMEGYNWHFNTIPLSRAEPITVRKGERVRIHLHNKTMMHHPIHLHGHFFRLLNGQGMHAPLKHTVDVPMGGDQTIEFLATEDKDWIFHCHNLYHMKGGMSRVIAYEGSSNYTDELRHKISHDNAWFYDLEADIASHLSEVKGRYFNARYSFEVEAESNYEHHHEAECSIGVKLTPYSQLFAGLDWENGEGVLTLLGGRFLLPLMVEAEVRVAHDGSLRLQLGNEHQIAKRLKGEWFWNTDKEWRLQLVWEINKRLGLLASFDSEEELGAGLHLRW